MDRSKDYSDGVAFATKRAIEWLHKRADDMNDPHAKAILNAAAFHMGVEFRSRTKGGQ